MDKKLLVEVFFFNREATLQIGILVGMSKIREGGDIVNYASINIWP